MLKGFYSNWKIQLKLKSRLAYIKYSRDNQPNVESKDGNHIDVKEYYKIKGDLLMFLIIILCCQILHLFKRIAIMENWGPLDLLLLIAILKIIRWMTFEMCTRGLEININEYHYFLVLLLFDYTLEKNIWSVLNTRV